MALALRLPHAKQRQPQEYTSTTQPPVFRDHLFVTSRRLGSRVPPRVLLIPKDRGSRFGARVPYSRAIEDS